MQKSFLMQAASSRVKQDSILMKVNLLIQRESFCHRLQGLFNSISQVREMAWIIYFPWFTEKSWKTPV
jgi:hypothetical protein